MTQLGAAIALAFCAASSPLAAKEVTSPQEARVELARDLASAIQKPGFAATVRKHLVNHTPRIADILNEYVDTARKEGAADTVADMRDLDRQAIRLRGLSGQLSALARVRVQGADGHTPLATLDTFLTAAVTKDPTTGEKRVVTFDTQGKEMSYALSQAPRVPMLVVETGGESAIEAGMALVNTAFGGGVRADATWSSGVESHRDGGVHGWNDVGGPPRHGSNAAYLGAELAEDQPDAPQGGALTQLKQIYLTTDQESNWDGDAEIFALISGIDGEGKAHITMKDVPWLDHDKRWYPEDPGASMELDLIDWSEFAGNKVNVHFFEDDGGVNFQTIIGAMKKWAGGDKSWVALSEPQADIDTAILSVGQLMKAAAPGKFFSSTSHVDSFYLIERGKSYGSRETPHAGDREEAHVVMGPH